MMWTRKRIVILAAIALGTTGAAMAQTGANPSPAGAPAAAARHGKRASTGRHAGRKDGGATRQIKRLETVLGRPLTDSEKQAVAAAETAHREAVAKAVGLSVEELSAKEKASRAARKAGGSSTTAARPVTP